MFCFACVSKLHSFAGCFLLCQANYILDTATCACVLSNSQCQGINCTERK